MTVLAKDERALAANIDPSAEKIARL